MLKNKNLPLDDNLILVKLSTQKYGYIFEYKLANVFYKGLMSFNDKYARLYKAYYSIVVVEDMKLENHYYTIGSSVQFCPLREYLQTCKYKHLKPSIKYDTDNNIYKLKPSELNIIEGGF